MESGESPWEGIVREVKEEVCIDVEVIKLLGIYSKLEKDELIFSFLCNWTNGELDLSDEADQIEFFNLSSRQDF